MGVEECITKIVDYVEHHFRLPDLSGLSAPTLPGK